MPLFRNDFLSLDAFIKLEQERADAFYSSL